MKSRSFKSKAVATWLAILGGAFGLHRFYLHGVRDLWGWLYPVPTVIGLYGVHRMQTLGQDDRMAWVLIPLLGVSSCCYLLTGMTASNWAWFTSWLVVGLMIYFSYGRLYSKLNKATTVA